MKMRVAREIARKDIIDSIRNLHILFCLLFPIVISFLFHFLISQPGNSGKLTIVIDDQDSSRLVDHLRNLPFTQIVSVTSTPELETVVVDKKATGGLEIPAGFDRDVDAGKIPQLTIYLNPQRDKSELAAFQQLIQAQAMEMVSAPKPVDLLWVNIAGATSNPPSSSTDPSDSLLAFLLIMGLVITGTLMVPMLLVEEKESHTLEALLVSPAGPSEVIAGKALAGLFYSFVISGLLMILNRGWQGNFLISLSAITIGSFFCTIIGLLLGSLFQNMHQVNTWASMALLAMILPAWSGLFSMPGQFNNVIRVIPTYYVNHLLLMSLGGHGTTNSTWLDFFILVVSSLCAFAVVVWILSKREQKA